MDENNEVLEYSDIYFTEEQDNIDIEETVEIIDVSGTPIYTVDSDVAFPALGEANESLNHQLLNGKELPDQHPITAITGLREELNDIEALDVVYSDKRNQADYYLWKDENVLQENRVGYFVSACSDINEIELCTASNDIFGVTVDAAGFVGAQDDIVRDIKYGLVVTNGLVHVRCESSVNIGDYVVSNDYGYAQKNKNGYKVVGRHQIDGLEYAEIALVTPIGRICELSNEVDNVSARMDNAETNIVAAMNVANAAYNKAGEASSVSEEAVKNALDALKKSEGVETDINTFLDEAAPNINKMAAEAKAIAESAAVSAEAIRSEAVKTSNEALASVNDLIKDLEPITTWSDPDSGNTGAEYLTTYIKDGLATKAEIQTVETMTEDNKSAIEHNAESFRTLISSVDKYSVGEYSQSYGLTHQQAESILKEGMIYVPTKHNDTPSHSEIFVDIEEENWFTPGSYYIWTINDQGIYDWVETKEAVAFFSEMPIPGNALKYWYIDSDEAPEGYEARALYIYEKGKWIKVNIFYNNPGNRMVSSISQEVDNISLEITNARGSYAGLNARLEADNEAQVAMVASVVGEDGKVTAASIINSVNDSGSSVTINGNHIILNGAATNGNGTFSISEDGHMKATGGTIGGWNIHKTRLVSTNDSSDYTVCLSDYNNGSDNSRIFSCTYGTDIDSASSDTMSIRRNGEIRVGVSKENQLRIQSGHIDFYYNDNKAGRLGQMADPAAIAIEGCPLWCDQDIYMGSVGRYLRWWDYENGVTDVSVLGVSGNKNIVLGSSLQPGNTNIYSGSGHSIKFYDGLDTRFISLNEILFYHRTVESYDGNNNPQYKDQLVGLFNNRGLRFPNNYGILLNGEYYAFRYYDDAVYVGINAADISCPLKLTGSTITANGTAVTSDERKKNTIVKLDDKYMQLFDVLSAKTYRFNEHKIDTTNCGFIAQELLTAMSDVGLQKDDFGAFVDVYGDGREYAIDYTQFIPIMWEEIKSLRDRISELENKE